MPLSRGPDLARAARTGVRDEQTASVLGALSPTARRILKAARRVLERDGYEALSLRRIAAEAGETRSLIAYHFENKAGLVTTLVDSLWHDADIALAQEVEGLAADARGRVLALTGLHLRLAEQPGLYRTYFDLLPHILRDDEARARLTRTYRSYRRIGELCLAPSAGREVDPLALATLLLAMGEGIAVQALVSGDAAILRRTFAALESRTLRLLGLAPPAAPREAAASDDLPTASPPVSPELSPDFSPDVFPDFSPGTSPDFSPDVSPDGKEPSAAFMQGAEDPAAGLTPAGARVLNAAVALADDEGLRSLSAESLARASGEPASSVYYYFGDKRGLLAAVVATSDYKFGHAVARAAGRLAPHRAAPATVAGVLQKVFAQPGWMRLLFDVLPVVLRDDELREREAAFFARLRSGPVAVLRRDGFGADEAAALALLSQSLVFGLAVQKLVDRRGTPVAAAIDTWQALLEQ